MITVRDDRPVNLVSAFENPVKSKDGFVDESIKRLFAEKSKAEKFVHKPLLTLYVTKDGLVVPEDGVEEANLSKLLEDFSDKLSTLLV